MRLLVLSLFCLLGSIIFAQDAPSWQLSGTVLDADTGLPIAGVNIEWEGQEKGAISDEKGSFALTIDVLPAQINISFLGYKTQQLFLATPREREMTIHLQATDLILPEAVISATPIIEKITQKNYTVRDFVFYNDQILLLTTSGISEGNQLTLIDFDGTILLEKNIANIKNIATMKRGCLGNIHILTGWKDFEIGIDSTQIKVLSENPRWQYERYLRPCIEASEEYVYYHYLTHEQQALHYTAFHKESEKAIDFQTIADIENLSKYAEDQASVMASGSLAQWDAFKQLFYRPINAPLINIGEELCIFNHLDGFLEFYNFEAEEQRAVPIQYHLDKNWDEKIFWDKAERAAYALFDTKNGKNLCKINLENGQLGPPWTIPCQYIEKMTVYAGHLFYLESGVLEHQRNRILHKVKLF